MNYKEYENIKKKFVTKHRDDMYHVIRDNDDSGIFSEMTDIFLISFSIGFHRKIRKTAKGSGSINHVNCSSIPIEIQDLIILLVLDRHKEIECSDDLWMMVEEYAEAGIEVLYESLRLSEWVLDIRTLRD